MAVIQQLEMHKVNKLSMVIVCSSRAEIDLAHRQNIIQIIDFLLTFKHIHDIQEVSQEVVMK